MFDLETFLIHREARTSPLGAKFSNNSVFVLETILKDIVNASDTGAQLTSVLCYSQRRVGRQRIRGASQAPLVGAPPTGFRLRGSPVHQAQAHEGGNVAWTGRRACSTKVPPAR